MGPRCLLLWRVTLAFEQIAAGIEGHPDNVAPAIYGGIQIGYDSADGMGGTGRWGAKRCRFPDGMQCILYIPYTTAKTSEARGLLKDQIERTEAVRHMCNPRHPSHDGKATFSQVFNITRTALLINALNTNDMETLK